MDQANSRPMDGNEVCDCRAASEEASGPFVAQPEAAPAICLPPEAAPLEDEARTIDISIDRQVKRVLLADDDPVQCLILKKALTDWGYDVDVSYDGPASW